MCGMCAFISVYTARTIRKQQYTFSLHSPPSSAVIMRNNNICCFSFLFGCFRLCFSLLSERTTINQREVYSHFLRKLLYLPTHTPNVLSNYDFVLKRLQAPQSWNGKLPAAPPHISFDHDVVSDAVYSPFVYDDAKHITKCFHYTKNDVYLSWNCFINFHFNLKFRRRGAAADYFDPLSPTSSGGTSDIAKHQHKVDMADEERRSFLKHNIFWGISGKDLLSWFS